MLFSTCKPAPVKSFASGLSITHDEARALIQSGAGREGAVIRAAFHRDYAIYSRPGSSVDANRMAIRGAIIALEQFRAEREAIVDRFARCEPTAEDRAWWAAATETAEQNWAEYEEWSEAVEPSLEGCDHWGGSGYADGE